MMNSRAVELTERVEFIGRADQLDCIDQQIAHSGETVVVNIVGAGGIGKTTLLNHIYRTYESQPDILLTSVIDFSQTARRVQAWVIGQLTDIHEGRFSTYHQTIEGIEDLMPLSRQYREREALDAFVEDYNALAKEYRIVLFFDTIELVHGTPLLTFILDLVRQLDNTVLILAGRPASPCPNNLSVGGQTLDGLLSDRFGKQNITSLRLTGFTEQEAQEYFEKALINLDINDNLQDNLYLLSDGRPIKIALAIDWLKHNIPLMPQITQWQPEELRELIEAAQQNDSSAKQELTRRREEFDAALMRGIDKLEGDLNEVILYMAHLNKRFNWDMLQQFFPSESQGMLIKLKSLPFVKYLSDDYFVLHDEMTRLVQIHIWDKAEDPDKSQRRYLSSEAIQYYNKVLDSMPIAEKRSEQEKINYWAYRVERMYYSLYTDFEEGYAEFEKLWEALVAAHRPELAALAVNFLREFENEPGYSHLLSCFVEGYYNGGVLLAHQKSEQAEEVLYLGLQKILAILDDFNFDQANEIDQRLSQRLYRVYHQLGFCYRSLGDLEKSSANYRKSLERALDLFDELKTTARQPLMAQVGETLNSLANVQRLKGELHKARLLCQTSIFVRQAWDPDRLARSYYVMAMLLWELGGTSEAMRYLRQADKYCLPGDESTEALIKKYRAYILFRAGMPREAVRLLNQVEPVFRKRGQFSDLVHVLNMRSRISRQHYDELQQEENLEEDLTPQNYMEVAEKYGDEAYKLAQQISDNFRLAESHLTKAFHYQAWMRIDPSRSQEYRQKALEHWSQGVGLSEGQYYRLLSLYSQVRGNLAFEESDYAEAIERYTEECKLATNFKRAVYERAIDNIGERLRELAESNPNMAKGYIRKITNDWRRHPDRKSVV